jgi:atlastin
MKNVQDNDLEMLDYFINYCLSAYDEEKMMYANLILLIRDWIWSSESEFGFWGGNCLLKSEFSSICPNLEKCFQKVNCFLMPKPGKRVEEDKKYDGSLCDVEKLFKKHILEFTSEIFNREKLAIKKINGNAMTCRDLSSFMFHYIKLLKSDEMPKVETYLEMNIMLNNLKTINQLCDWYKQQMRETIKQKYLDIDSLNRLHTAKVNEALKKFDKVRKIGNAETNIQDYKNKLQNKIEDEYIHFKNENHLRKSFNE